MTALERSLQMLGWAIATISLSFTSIYAIELVLNCCGNAPTVDNTPMRFQPANQGQPATTIAPASR